MGYGANPNDSDFTIVTVVLQYGVFATLWLGKYFQYFEIRRIHDWVNGQHQITNPRCEE